MTEEENIIHLCQVISHWVSKRGEATVRREVGIFEHCDQEVKKWIKELEKRVGDEQGRINQTPDKA